MSWTTTSSSASRTTCRASRCRTRITCTVIMVSYKCHCPSLSTAKRNTIARQRQFACRFVPFVCPESDLRNYTGIAGSRHVIDCIPTRLFYERARFKTIVILPVETEPMRIHVLLCVNQIVVTDLFRDRSVIRIVFEGIRFVLRANSTSSTFDRSNFFEKIHSDYSPRFPFLSRLASRYGVIHVKLKKIKRERSRFPNFFSKINKQRSSRRG